MSAIQHSPIREVSTVTIRKVYEKRTSDVLFFYILSGEVECNVNGALSHLTSQDVLMVGPLDAFTARSGINNLLVMIALRGDFFALGQSERLGRFVVNSALDRERDYDALRKLITQIALAQYEKSDVSQLNQHALAYSLLYYINRYHYVTGSASEPDSEGDKYAERRARILTYMEQNYMNALSLQDIANFMYLTPTYLSRFFKKHMGVNFGAFLNTVRLEHAARDLLLSDASITNIAYGNGFAGTNAFTKVFREKYGESPREYRASHAAPASSDDEASSLIPVDARENPDISRTLTHMMERGGDESLVQYPSTETYVVEDVRDCAQTVPIWKTMINIGFSSTLSNYNLQSHLIMAQKEIGFKFGRIQGVLNDDMTPMLPGEDTINFSDFDRYIDMMLSIHMTPFLDLTFKADYLFLTGSEFVYLTSSGKDTTPPNKLYYQKITALIRHCINTFGVLEVEKWGFEIGYSHDEFLHLTESPATFVQRFHRTYTLIKSLLPKAIVGGPCHNVTMSADVFREIVQEMLRARFSPDFISLCVFPYESIPNDAGEPSFVRASDPDFAKHKVDRIRGILAAYPDMTQSICVSVFGTDLKTRNHVNDSCFQSSFIAKHTIDLIGRVDMLGYWQLSDIGNEYVDTSRILFGGTGILGKHGLKKPGFTALKRLGYLHPMLIRAKNGVLVSTNAINTYNIVMTNYAHFNDYYCIRENMEIALENVYSVFDSPSVKDATLTLKNLENGRYKIVMTTLNREYGSLLDEWVRYGILDDLHPRDIQYFRDIVHPHRVARYESVSNNTLDIHVHLLPHEVRFIDVLREL